jgi:hypothetical protein
MKRAEANSSTLLKNLTHPGWIKFKGLLFLAVGILSAVLLILEQPSLKAVLLLILSIWCFCRFYYFAFYVITNYIDPGYRFSGLGSFFVYLLSKRPRNRVEKE